MHTMRPILLVLFFCENAETRLKKKGNYIYRTLEIIKHKTITVNEASVIKGTSGVSTIWF